MRPPLYNGKCTRCGQAFCHCGEPAPQQEAPEPLQTDHKSAESGGNVTDEEQAYRDKLFPCTPPCDTFGVCDNCCERKVYCAGYIRGKREGRRLEREEWLVADEECRKAKEADNQMIHEQALRIAALERELEEIRNAYNFDMKRRDENDEYREEEHTKTLFNQQNNHQRQMTAARAEAEKYKAALEKIANYEYAKPYEMTDAARAALAAEKGENA